MDGVEGIILWIVAMLFAPFIVLFYVARYTYLRVFDANGPASRRQPFEVEVYAMGLCVVWAGIIGAILYAIYA